jgi:hypothetical protein
MDKGLESLVKQSKKGFGKENVTIRRKNKGSQLREDHIFYVCTSIKTAFFGQGFDFQPL